MSPTWVATSALRRPSAPSPDWRELISPLGPDTGVAKFLEKNGPGLHHVAYQTTDIVQALATLTERGVKLIDEEPRVGIRNSHSPLTSSYSSSWPAAGKAPR